MNVITQTQLASTPYIYFIYLFTCLLKWFADILTMDIEMYTMQLPNCHFL